MRWVFVLILFFISYPVVLHAQDGNNYLIITTNSTLSWSLNSVTEMENDQTITGSPGAIRIQIKTRAKQRSLMARISSITGPSGFTITSPYPVQLVFASENPSSGNGSTPVNTLTLTNTNQTMLTQPANNNTVYNYYYNVKLLATNWLYPPGTYNFTITFTLTPP